MGIFKSIFSSKDKESNEFTSRVEFKNEQFFNNGIRQEEDIIKVLIEDNKKLDQRNELVPFNFWNISMKYLRKVYLKYSLGEKISLIKKDYLSALDYYIKGWDEKEATYSDMIVMVSLGILFKIPDTAIDQLIDYVEKTENNPNLKDWQPDYVLGYLLNYRNPAKKIQDSILIPKMYQGLVALTKLTKEEAQLEMKKYLESWYGLHKNDPWYNNHKRQSGYKGYWCWDAGAVVKVMGLDDSSFKDHLHYPYDMVHWQETQPM